MFIVLPFKEFSFIPYYQKPKQKCRKMPKDSQFQEKFMRYGW